MYELIDKLITSIADFFFYLLNSIFDFFVSLIKLIPVPSFLENVSPLTIPDTIAFFAEPYDLPYGIAIITSAYAARFLIRRLPFIG